MGFNLNAADTAINLLAVCGVLSYAVFLYRRRDRSATERRLFWAVLVQALLFLAQAFHRQAELGQWLWVEMVARACVPMSLALVVEAAGRRHLPLPVKVWVTLPFVVLPAVYYAYPQSTHWLIVYGGLLAVTIVCLITKVARRVRSEVSEAENRYLDTILFAGAAFVPLAITDLPELLPLGLPLRLGGLGALIFVYISLHSTVHVELISRPVAELIRMLGLATVCAALVRYLAGAPLAGGDAGNLAPWLATLSLVFAVLLTNAILSLLQEYRAIRSRTSFHDWLGRADARTLATFLAAFADYPLTASYVYLRRTALQAYDVPQLASKLASEGGRLSLGRIRRHKKSAPARDYVAYEQLEHLLLTHRANVAYLLGPDSLMLFSVSSLGDGGHRQRELQTVVKIVATLELQPSSASAPGGSSSGARHVPAAQG